MMSQYEYSKPSKTFCFFLRIIRALLGEENLFQNYAKYAKAGTREQRVARYLSRFLPYLKHLRKLSDLVSWRMCGKIHA